MNETRRLLPEERELERLGLELESKTNFLADRELELANLRTRLTAFERLYIERVGRLYVKLDELEAELAAALAGQFPTDERRTGTAQTSKERAESSRQEYEQRAEALGAVEQQQKEATPELRSLYRKLAKEYHPDCVLDAQEKLRRSAVMARVNEAFAKGDYEALLNLEAELAIMPDTVSGEGLGFELIRVIRKIAQIDARLTEIEQEILTLKQSELGQLAERYEKTKKEGSDLLDILAADLERRIAEIEARLLLWRGDGHNSGARVVPSAT